MVEKTPILDRLTYVFLALAILVLGFPIYYAFVAASLPLAQVNQMPMPLTPGSDLFHNLATAWTRAHLSTLLWNSLVVATIITAGKILISILSAYAVTYFRFPGRSLAFWLIFFTLMLPVEVRILPTYEVMADVLSPLRAMANFLGLGRLSVSFNLSLLDSYTGLTLPLMASATATFLFRQFFLTLPDELQEAATLDGASPMQFFWKVVLPLSKTNIAALIVITFVYGWNQYLWPLLMTTQKSMKVAVVGIQELLPTSDQAPEWNVAMAGALLVMIPPILVTLSMQKYFVKGLVENEK